MNSCLASSLDSAFLSDLWTLLSWPGPVLFLIPALDLWLQPLAQLLTLAPVPTLGSTSDSGSDSWLRLLSPDINTCSDHYIWNRQTEALNHSFLPPAKELKIIPFFFFLKFWDSSKCDSYLSVCLSEDRVPGHFLLYNCSLLFPVLYVI